MSLPRHIALVIGIVVLLVAVVSGLAWLGWRLDPHSTSHKDEICAAGDGVVGRAANGYWTCTYPDGSKWVR